MPDYSLHFDPVTGRLGRISPTGSAVVAELKRLAGGGFAGAPDPNAWTTANSGAGSSATITNTAVLNPGTTSGGFASVQSTITARFLFASANLFRCNVRIQALGGNSVQSWGAFTFGTAPAIQDGFYYSYNGTSLQINYANAGVVTTVAPNAGAFTMDTADHLYEIIYQVAGATFLIDNNIVHKVNPKMSLLTSTPHFPATALSTNTSASQGNNLEAWAMSIVRYGSSVSGTQAINISTLGTTFCKKGPGNLHRILLNTLNQSNVITVYDSLTASGTIIAQFNASASNTVPGFIDVDLDFNNGLTVSSVGGTASNITIILD